MDENLLMHAAWDAVFAGGNCLIQRNTLLHQSVLLNRSDSRLVREPDVVVGEEIKRILERTGFLVFSEEVDDPISRGSAQGFWWVDPIDGTRGYLAGEKEYGISVGFVACDNVPQLGVVYQPAYSKLFYGSSTKGAKLRDISAGVEYPLAVSSRAGADLVGVLGSHSFSEMERFYSGLDLSARYGPIGSFTAKVLAVVEGRGDVYVKLGNKCNAWDSCAVEVILREAGGRITDLEGKMLKYNVSDPNFNNGILVSNGVYHELLVEKLRKLC